MAALHDIYAKNLLYEALEAKSNYPTPMSSANAHLMFGATS